MKVPIKNVKIQFSFNKIVKIFHKALNLTFFTFVLYPGLNGLNNEYFFIFSGPPYKTDVLRRAPLDLPAGLLYNLVKGACDGVSKYIQRS